MQVGDYIKTSIYGHILTVRIIAIPSDCTMDVMTKDGQCFRVSGGAK
jgi:hypothetical protein